MRPERLSRADAARWHMSTPENPMVIGALLLFEQRLTLEALDDLASSKLVPLRRFHQHRDRALHHFRDHCGRLASLHAAADLVGLRPIDGGRLTLRPFPTVTTQLLAEERDGLRVAPWPRVYVDLRAAGVRDEEAAEHLREFRHGR